MSLKQVLSAEPLPLIPSELEPFLDKYIRDLHNYLRRLWVIMSEETITNSLESEGFGGGIVPFRISGTPTRNSTRNQWSYPITEAVKAGAGHEGWVVKPEGRTNITAYSIIEDSQSGAVTNGGINTSSDDFPDGFDGKPLQNNTVLYCKEERFIGGGSEWQIVNHATQVDGTCDPAPLAQQLAAAY